MTTKFSIRNALSMKAKDVEPGIQLPIGFYNFGVVNVELPEGNGKWEQVVFKVSPVQVLDADEEDLTEWQVRTGKQLNECEIRHTFLFSVDDESASADVLTVMTTFLVEHLEAGEETEEIQELLNNAQGKIFSCEIKHKPNKRLGSGLTEAYIASTAAAGDAEED